MKPMKSWKPVKTWEKGAAVVAFAVVVYLIWTLLF